MVTKTRMIFDTIVIVTIVLLIVAMYFCVPPFKCHRRKEQFNLSPNISPSCGLCKEMFRKESFTVQKFCEKGFCYKAQDDDMSKKVMSQLKDFYLDIIAVLPPDDERTKTLKRRFKINNDVLFEVDPNNNENLTSYTLNKGAGMGLCLRQRGADTPVVDLEVIKFVFAHELSHVFTKSYDHTPEFWDNFKWLLSHLYNTQLLELIDFKATPKKYCGLTIDSNPYLDD